MSTSRHDDGQWSQGLISAAQMVASATGNLCEAANQAVQGEASEEWLVTSAKQVASSTAQLLVACKVKADPNSENMKRLQVRNVRKQNVKRKLGEPCAKLYELCVKCCSLVRSTEVAISFVRCTSTVSVINLLNNLQHIYHLLDIWI